MSTDDELKHLANRIGKALSDLAHSQEQLAGELARRCEQHAAHFEKLCVMLEGGSHHTEPDVIDFERMARVLAEEAWSEGQREAA
ncbi:MAG: hypothetical protein IT537_13270 [Hyphomicrobiales bacterium]|nr:hypothetical protein [Hyphomicrobiales bacterium]